MSSWKIWYNNGLIITGSTVEEWIASPEDGVLGIYEFLGWDNGAIMDQSDKVNL
jgi:hypothetical protein